MKELPLLFRSGKGESQGGRGRRPHRPCIRNVRLQPLRDESSGDLTSRVRTESIYELLEG